MVETRSQSRVDRTPKVMERWHHTYPVEWRDQHYVSCFRARSSIILRNCRIHLGELRDHMGRVAKTEVTVFQSLAKERAEKIKSDLAFMEKVVQDCPALQSKLKVVHPWVMEVDSVDYRFFKKPKTIHKDDIVLLQLQVSEAGKKVDYDANFSDVSQLCLDHPFLGHVLKLPALQTRGKSSVSSLRAVVVGDVYYLTSFTLRSAAGQISTEGGQHTTEVSDRLEPSAPCPPDAVSDDQTHPASDPDRLTPTAPEEVMPSAPECEDDEDTVDCTESVLSSEQLCDPDRLTPTAPDPEEEAPSPPESDDELPPPYEADVGYPRIVLPREQQYDDPPPDYESVFGPEEPPDFYRVT